MVSHIWEVLIITQELQQWTQMLQFGREPISMMERFMVKSNINRMPTISRPTVNSKKWLLILESHMHQPSSFPLKPQEVMPRTRMESHILMVAVIIIQEPHQWTQMLWSGKEPISMMERSMEKNNINKMPMISRPMVRSKRLLLTPEFHICLPFNLKPKLQVHQ